MYIYSINNNSVAMSPKISFCLWRSAKFGDRKIWHITACSTALL